MSLAERRSPFDSAPDWTGQTYGQRVSSAFMTLKLFGFLSEEEAAVVAERIEKWFERGEWGGQSGPSYKNNG
ncbi:MAG: hypothetical protein ACPLRH_08295 [Desulfotomaculales bacterium]